ncbi:MAG: carboxypeptidase-like regulatory domain-containing protein [Chloroflexota bacterium]|nr:carboxypeptidase-like regulatory domain-containing protein [Chloroflexota bacterium]
MEPDRLEYRPYGMRAAFAPLWLAALLVVVVLAACAPGASPRGSGTVGGAVSGRVTAGPICPVEQQPPDPACAARPVAGAVLLVQDAAGREVARATSAANGSFSVTLEPGAYRLVPQPKEGLMGTPAAMEFRVDVGVPTARLQVTYDTGIR